MLLAPLLKEKSHREAGGRVEKVEGEEGGRGGEGRGKGRVRVRGGGWVGREREKE